MYNREALARHEAGHAVAHILTKTPFDYVTIEANDDNYGHVQPNCGPTIQLWLNLRSRQREISALARDTVINLWAGDVAEEIFLGHPPSIESATDIADIEEIAIARSTQPQVWAQRLKYRTRKMLLNSMAWHYITTVALALLEKQKLTDREIYALLKLDYPWED